MTLHLHRAERADRLAAGLADLLATPLADPFEDELVVVPAHGVERWLAQQLGHRLGAAPGREDGVCAGIRFVRPRSLVAELLDTGRDDAWSGEQLVWPLLGVIDESLGEPWCAALSRHLGHQHTGVERDLRRDRRYGVARRLASLFHTYAVQRPEMVARWDAGHDDDGHGTPLGDDTRWQAEVWRRLTGRVAAPAPHRRIADAVEQLRESPDAVDLPARLSLFGHTRLPLGELRLVGALAEGRDVHLWLPHPSPVLWASLAEPLAREGVVRRADAPAPTDAPNPLLVSLGRDARELQRSLTTLGTPAVDEHLPLAARPDTLLGRLQHDLVHDTSGGPDRVLADDDRSVQVHACHGRVRQVDVLREVLVGLLEDDPTLEPRDILVMCPDVEAYAPLIQAAFGLEGVAPDGHPAHGLRVRLADRAVTSTNPLFGVAVALLRLAATGRATATEVLDLLATAPVRRRFRLSDDDLRRLTEWVEHSGVRWALDAEHRAPFGVGGVTQNTWRAGVDRVLLGVALDERPGGWIDDVLPLDEVGSGSVELAGRLGEILERLRAAVDALRPDQPVRAWAEALTTSVAALADAPARDGWQADQLHRELSRVVESAGDADRTLRLAEVQDLVADRLGGRPTRANFRTGTLTVCTMVPMRSVPHRVVCMLGLDDGVFPRVGAPHGDDVLARDPRTGERDIRGEDRQLFLDAILAATETLVVTYAGADEQTGQPRPPAVPLGELLDQLDRTVDHPDLRSRVVTHHPLQPFDPRTVRPGALGTGDRPFSFDPAALAGARAALASVPRAPEPFLAAPLPPVTTPDVSLARLTDFAVHPVKAFLRQRLDVGVPAETEAVADDVPIDLGGLAAWGIGDRLLSEVVAGADPVDALGAAPLRGDLPPGELGTAFLRRVIADVQPLVERTATLRAGEAQTIDVDVALPDGRRVVGTVGGVHGDAIVTLTYSSVRAKQRMRAWVGLLALAAARPDTTWTSHVVGRGFKQLTHARATVTAAEALALLADLVALRDDGLREPLPLPLQTSLTYAGAIRRMRRDIALSKARGDWDGDRFNDRPGESDDAHHAVVWGAGASYETLLSDGRFEGLATRLWSPLLDHEAVGRL